jgi:glycerol-3-phosphate dehydrogenase (NAD+)
MIQSELNLDRGVAVVMGANVANEVAEDQFVESTVGCMDKDVSKIVSDLLDCPCFRTSSCSDVGTVELCGALKNVVAMGAGFCDSLGLGSSSKAAVIRKGLEETMAFCEIISGPSFNRDIILQSCGLADCIASSYGGRNRKCAAEFATWLLNDSLVGQDGDRVEVIKTVWKEIETRVLGGQKLQGVLTCDELMECLRFKNLDTEILPEDVKRPRESYAQYMSHRYLRIYFS